MHTYPHSSGLRSHRTNIVMSFILIVTLTLITSVMAPVTASAQGKQAAAERLLAERSGAHVIDGAGEVIRGDIRGGFDLDLDLGGPGLNSAGGAGDSVDPADQGFVASVMRTGVSLAGTYNPGNGWTDLPASGLRCTAIILSNEWALTNARCMTEVIGDTQQGYAAITLHHQDNTYLAVGPDQTPVQIKDVVYPDEWAFDLYEYYSIVVPGYGQVVVPPMELLSAPGDYDARGNVAMLALSALDMNAATGWTAATIGDAPQFPANLGETFTYVAFGSDEALASSDVVVSSPTGCRVDGAQTDDYWCGGILSDGPSHSEACAHDRGAAVVDERFGTPHVVGLLGFSVGCDQVQSNMLNPKQFLPWIQGVMAGLV